MTKQRQIDLWPEGRAARVSPWLLAIGAGAFLLLPYLALAQLEPYASRDAAEKGFDRFLLLVIPTIVSYTILVSISGIRAARRELALLRPSLAIDPETFSEISGLFSRLSRGRLIALVPISLLIAGALQEYASGRLTRLLELADASLADVWLLLMGLAVWTSVLLWVGVAARSANTFRKLAAKVERIDPFNIDPTRPFGRVGLRLALYAAGAIAIFTIPPVFIVPDFKPLGVGSAISMISAVVTSFIFLLHTWGIHRRLADRKRELLAGVQRELADLPEPAIPQRRQLLDLLEYRNRLQGASEWPFGTTSLVRLALYTAIPLASMIAAALVERAVDRIIT